jgi:fructoselysine-6-P-deglycase FrlB-like protein
VNSIEAMQTEIGYQVQDLQKLETPSLDRNCLFVGSGDSYVAGLAAQYVSGNQASCCYPIDVVQNASLVNGRHVYFVSISGNTRDNILAARIAKKQGVRITAITARPTSKLAKICDQVIALKYRNAGMTTAGTISFTTSVLTCVSLVKNLELPADLDKIFRKAKNQAERAVGKIINKRSFIMLGNGALYLAAIYGTFKFNEIFGARAVSYPAEEFCHSPLFSVKQSDQIIVIGSDSGHLNKRLRHEGFSSVHVNMKSAGIELLFQSIFFVQLLVLRLAQKRGLVDCYFLKNKKLLKMSSDLIYD